MLTQAQIDARKGKVTASMVGKLMTGSAEDINTLWDELTGRREPDDLAWKWPVYLGTHTEALHLDWLEHALDTPITRRGEVVSRDWAACTLDGWAGYPVEAKHTGGYEQMGTIWARYYPQCQWQMYVTGADTALLSVIMGAKEPARETIARDDAYIAEMVPRARAFLDCVEQDRRPFDLPEPPQPVTYETLRKIDLFSDDSNWGEEMAELLDTWSDTVALAKANEAAAAAIKKLLPDDVGEVTYGRTTIKRAKNGAVSIKEMKA